MAPSTRANPALTRKIATLQLTLAPFVPLPAGVPHPAFPKTLLAFHLLTEDELDSLAHYYHQSTPGPWTHQYPATMNWDKDFLARPSAESINMSTTRRLSQTENDFLTDLMQTVSDLSSPRNAFNRENESDDDVVHHTKLSDRERIRIKRRKVGKFIGLVGMETPIEEIAGRLQASLDRAVERSRAEMQKTEELFSFTVAGRINTSQTQQFLFGTSALGITISLHNILQNSFLPDN
ncbi:hypothetical protein AMS68_000950 [Peltaster fructicola]|uniref:Uncharacterized protein n=1 Tax=Peltaster fructicola TaxID=286661 RepID=A0A6H0XL38_9PEZI|nr:hypothetical protein AMS68_000950 [Peltaster fructicola]